MRSVLLLLCVETAVSVFYSFLPSLVFFSLPVFCILLLIFFLFQFACLCSTNEEVDGGVMAPPLFSIPSLVFIAVGREGHLTTVLPMSWHRVGWAVMACINGGRVWNVTCVQVLWASGRGKRRRITGKDFKNSLLPCLCICRGEEAALRRSKRNRAVFFFFEEKENEFGSGLKMSYDISYLIFFPYTVKRT